MPLPYRIEWLEEAKADVRFRRKSGATAALQVPETEWGHIGSVTI
jgi:hypothetical protein